MICSIDYHITDKCNLNCAYCNHFCPLVPTNTEHKSIEQITYDLCMLSKIKDDIDTISLLGGEPTLHPELNKILDITRKIFPNNKITLTTNGTTYNRFVEWKESIERNNIEVNVTLYPYCDDYLDRYAYIHAIIPNNSSFFAWPSTDGFNDMMLSNNKGVSTQEEIMNCYKRYRCRQLKDGKLYICHYAAQLNYLKNAFPGQVQAEWDGCEYFDLTKNDFTIEDVDNWAYSCHPSICDYCYDAKYGTYTGVMNPWKRSEYKLNEWVK